MNEHTVLLTLSYTHSYRRFTIHGAYKIQRKKAQRIMARVGTVFQGRVFELWQHINSENGSIDKYIERADMFMSPAICYVLCLLWSKLLYIFYRTPYVRHRDVGILYREHAFYIRIYICMYI